MATLTGDDLPACIAQALTESHADLDDEAACTAVLVAARSHFLLREIAANLDEALAIAEAELMNCHCALELAEVRAGIDAELAR